MEIKPTNIEGEEYYTVQQFAVLCGKGLSQIYGLIHKGIIKNEKFFNKTFIPVSQEKKIDKLFPTKDYKYTGSHYV